MHHAKIGGFCLFFNTQLILTVSVRSSTQGRFSKWEWDTTLTWSWRTSTTEASWTTWFEKCLKTDFKDADQESRVVRSISMIGFEVADGVKYISTFHYCSHLCFHLSVWTDHIVLSVSTSSLKLGSVHIHLRLCQALFCCQTTSRTNQASVPEMNWRCSICFFLVCTTWIYGVYYWKKWKEVDCYLVHTLRECTVHLDKAATESCIGKKRMITLSFNAVLLFSLEVSGHHPFAVSV